MQELAEKETSRYKRQFCCCSERRGEEPHTHELRMLSVAVFTLLAASALAGGHTHYSFSPSVGDGAGTPYAIIGEGRITAVRVWEINTNYIYGMQIRYGGNWSAVAGYLYGSPLEMELFDNERIIQISGKSAHYIQSLVGVTDLGRSLLAGQPSGRSFNMYPTHRDAELRFVSGQIHGGLTSLQAHWAVLDGHSSEEDSRRKQKE